MLGLEGMGDVDAADREASFRLPAQRPADLPNGTEMRPAQVLVGAEPLPRPGEIEPGEDERGARRSEEHTSELQSLMRSSYAVFCLKTIISIIATHHTDIQYPYRHNASKHYHNHL